MTMQKAYRFETPTRTEREQTYLEALESAASESSMSNVERLMNFPAWVPRQNIARFLAQWEIYREYVLPIHGSIVEGGVCFGGGLFAWAQFAAIMEPANHPREVIGFDTFSGFPSIAKEDARAQSGLNHVGGMAAPVEAELERLVKLYDQNRWIAHIPKIRLVRGDANQTIPAFVRDNPHLVVAALVLDFDVYEPTRTALESFVSRMPRGAVIVFDELNCRDWPGETLAIMDYFATLGGLRLRRFPFSSTLCYAVLE